MSGADERSALKAEKPIFGHLLAKAGNSSYASRRWKSHGEGPRARFEHLNGVRKGKRFFYLNRP
jgi:hypothetical protein